MSRCVYEQREKWLATLDLGIAVFISGGSSRVERLFWSIFHIKYLSVMLHKGHKKVSVYDELITKLRKINWFGDNFICWWAYRLLKSVLASMPMYLLQIISFEGDNESNRVHF